MRTLAGLAYSGWTEKARWAMDHHRVPYRYREHLPMLGEWWLRRNTAKGVHPTVPLLVDPPGSVTGSFLIARRAEELGSGAPLFPASAAAAIAGWEDASDRALKVARANVVKNLLQNKRAQMESLPSFTPGWMRGMMAPSARMGARYLLRKHQVLTDVDAAVRDTVTPILEQLRAALRGRPYLQDGFTYADITSAVMLQFVRPVADRYLPLGPGTREVWSHPELAERFADLLEWRDGLYAKHRKP